MSEKKHKSQFERFAETARALECDDDQDRFEAKLGKIAKVPAKLIREDGAPAMRKAKPSKAKAHR
ncbi:MAG: hypothetical protein ACHQAY_23280 [Hyphomicrobiales bacterium]